VIRLTIALPLVLVGFPASGMMVEGGRLQDTCGNPQEVRQAACAGFIGGVIDSLETTGQFCIDPKIPPPVLIHRVVEYVMSNRPTIGGQPGSQQVLLALKANWPCLNGTPIPPYYPHGTWHPPANQLRPYFGIDPYGRPTVHWR
jgi:hypothetical protein